MFCVPATPKGVGWIVKFTVVGLPVQPNGAVGVISKAIKPSMVLPALFTMYSMLLEPEVLFKSPPPTSSSTEPLITVADQE